MLFTKFKRKSNINFFKLLIMIIEILGKEKDKKDIFWILIIILFQSLLDILSIASIIPLIYLVQDSNLIYKGNNIKNLIGNLDFSLGNNSENILIPLIVIFIMIISTTFRFFLIYKTNYFIEETRHYVASKLMNDFINKNQLLNIDTTKFAKAILSEVDQFIIVVIQPVILMLTNIILLLGVLFYLIYTNFSASIYGIIILISFYLLFHFFSKNILNREGYKNEASNRGRFKTAIESFRNIKDIKIYQAEQFFEDRFKKFSKSFSDTNAIYNTLTASPKYILEMLVFIALTLSILYFAIKDNLNFSIIPLLGTFAFAAYKAQPSLSSVIYGINSIEYGEKIILNIYEKLYKERLKNDLNSRVFKNYKYNSKDCIIIKDLDYSYNNSPKTQCLKKLNIKISYSSFFVIKGESGSGKTTLLNLITGLLKLKKGSIIINKNRYKNKTPKISFLHQEYSLFDSTIIENVAFGIKERNVDIEKLIRCLKQAEIYNYVFSLKNNIYEIVGENGSNLSIGQIQRLALARALYFEPDILLLDEPTSSLDIKTESQIIKTLYALSKKITIIISSHRPISLKNKSIDILELS